MKKRKHHKGSFSSIEKANKKRIVKHHIVNRSNGGKDAPENLLAIKEQREKAWHYLFGDLTILEVIDLLMRTNRMKHIS